LSRQRDASAAAGRLLGRVIESRVLPWFWLAVLVLLGCLNWHWWSLRPLTIDSDLMALLPEEQVPATVRQAQERLVAAAERRVVVLVGGGDLPTAIRAADAFVAALAGRSPSVGRIAYAMADTLRAGWGAFYASHHRALLPDALRAPLSRGEGARVVERALSWYYSPIGLPGRLSPTEDPFQLFGQWQLERAGASRLRPMQGRLVVVEGAAHYVAILLEIPGSPLESETQQRVVPALAAAREAASLAAPRVEVLAAGVVLHAAEATERAQREVWLIGLASFVGVLLLTLLAFRSVYLLLLAQIPTLVGCSAAVALSAQLFDGRLHSMTLVFGTSLLGVAVDNSLHFLCHTAPTDDLARRLARLQSLLPGMWLAWITTVLGYLALTIPPLLILQQMAIFSVIGLLFAWLTVLCWLPWLTRGGVRQEAAPVRLLSALRARWPRARLDRRTAVVVLVALAGIGLGLLRVRVNDDIRALQNSSPALLAAQQRVLALTGTPNPGQFLIVTGETPEAVLQAEEAMRSGLDRIRDQGLIAGYQALSQWVPSLARQREDQVLQDRHLYARGGGVETLGRSLGLSAAWVEIARGAQRAAATPLTLEAWLGAPASEPFRPQWLGWTGSGHASVVLLSGIQGRTGVDAVKRVAAEAPSAVWVDRVENLSGLLGRYRRQVGGVLALCYLLVLAVLILRYRRAAWRVLAPTVVASLAALALFGWLGWGVNLFTVLALLLVLGMGVDYAIYLQEERADHAGAWLGVTLAALSTIMSFGFLAFSRTPALQMVGVTLLVGIGLAWLLAPSLSAQREGKEPA
jgi:predicted exporter